MKASDREERIICLGSAHWDVIGQSEARMTHGQDVRGIIERRSGGVAGNIAVFLAQRALPVTLLAAVGNDAEGEQLLQQARAEGIDVDQVYKHASLPTDRYMAIESDDTLLAAIADTRCLEAAQEHIMAPLLDGRLGSAEQPWQGCMVVDGNLAPELLQRLAKAPELAAADLRVVSASNSKAERLRCFLNCERASLYVNAEEAASLLESKHCTARAAARELSTGALRSVVVTDGAVEVAQAIGAELYTATPKRVSRCRLTGAGDFLVAAHIAALRQGMQTQQALEYAVEQATSYVAGNSL